MKRIFFIALFSVFALAAFSQSSLTALQYSVGFGTGDMHEYIGNTSWRGFTLDYRNMVQTNIGVGVDLGWNVFYEEMPDAVYEFENITYAGKQWRYSNHFPVLVAADYYIRKGEMVSAFAGLGAGVMYSLQNTNMGTYTFEKDALFARINLQGDELAMYNRVHKALAEKIHKPDLIVYLRAETKMLLQRIAQRDRPYERDMDPEYIEQVNLAYDEFFLDPSHDRPVLVIDTNYLDYVRYPEDQRWVENRIRQALQLPPFQPELPLPVHENQEKFVF